jgi:hypothetical protein
LRPPGALKSAGALADTVLRRRSSWPSRQEAHETLRSRGMYATFDARVFNEYIEHGLAADGSSYRLQCEPWVESEIYKQPGSSIWERLHEISCPVWVLAGGTSKHLDAWGHGRTPDIYRRMTGYFRKGEFRLLEGLG